MTDELLIGNCATCNARLMPEDFNMNGAVRFADGRVYCRDCSLNVQADHGRRKGSGRSDTVVLPVKKPADATTESRQIKVTCLECGWLFDVVLEALPRYVFCPQCGKKLRMEMQ